MFCCHIFIHGCTAQKRLNFHKVFDWHIFCSCEMEYVLIAQFDIIFRCVAAQTLTHELHISKINMIKYVFISFDLCLTANFLW